MKTNDLAVIDKEATAQRVQHGVDEVSASGFATVRGGRSLAVRHQSGRHITPDWLIDVY